MKFAVVFPILFLSLMNVAIAEEASLESVNPESANVESVNVESVSSESNSDGTDYSAYCAEQAELSGIDGAAEKNRYIKECVDSFAPPADQLSPQ